MIRITGLFLFMISVLLACNRQKEDRFAILLEESPSIQGKAAYLGSPYVTAGDRVYMVGHQDGSFPELGWHIKGEMGGIWDHPIKLMDGFRIDLFWEDDTISLSNARSFVNYPVANKHLFNLERKNLEVERWQFVPDHKEGISVQLLMRNTGEARQNLELQFVGDIDLRPTWLGERTQMVDHQDHASYHAELDAWVAKDSANPWYVLFGADEQSAGNGIKPTGYSGKGTAAALSYRLSISPNSTEILNFTIAGSYRSLEDAVETYEDIQDHFFTYLEQKRDRYRDLARRSKLTVPDKKMQETFEWLKYNSDWLIRSVPETGTGIMAGIPDYPWWFGVDSEYALKGYMAIGREDIALKTIALLDSISDEINGNGRIVHEVSTNGAVFNKGNINETPQFASLIWEVYRWNGNKPFLKKYFPTIKRGLNWLMTENDENQNLFPEGFGMMEIHGLNSEMIDVASYTQSAFEDAAKMARELGEEELQEQYSGIARSMKEKINQAFWSGQFGSYADFIGTDEQALRLIEDAIVRADTLNKPWAVEELKATREAILKNPSPVARPFVMHHNWVVNTPMEMSIADEDKAFTALETAARFVNPFGVFVTGIDRDESAGADEGSFKGSKVFSYTGAVMTLPTGVVAVAENNYGRVDKGLDYLKRMVRSFSYALPGSMYEVSPDYGMMTQAWNIYGFAVPIVHQFFGLEPHAAQRQILISPDMPAEWHEASLENVIVGDNEVDLFYKRSEGRIWFKAVQEDPSWELRMTIPVSESSKIEVLEGAADRSPAEVSIRSTSTTVEFFVDEK